MKKVICFIIIFLTISSPAAALEAWVINNFHSDIAILTDGRVIIKENLAVDFFSEEKHGIYRDIPYIYQDEKGHKTYTEIAKISVVQDGLPAQYNVSKGDQNIRIRIGDPNNTISGKHTYVLNYLITGILRPFTDYDELYLNVTGNEWGVEIHKASANVSIPKDIIEGTVCFEGSRNYTTKCDAEQTTAQTATFMAKRGLSPAQGLTIAMKYTAGMVPILTVKPPKSLLEDIFTFPSQFAFLLSLLIGITIIFGLWWKNGRDFWFKTSSLLDQNAKQTTKPVGSHETTVVEFEPPEHLRPAEVGVLMDERADTLDVTSTIIDLAGRGFLTIVENQKKWIFGSVDYTITKKNEDTKSLLPYEELLLHKLFLNADEINVSSLRTTFYDDLAAVKKQLYQDVMKKKLFVTNPETIRGRYTVIGIGIVVLSAMVVGISVKMILGPIVTFGMGTIINGIFLLIVSRSMPRRSAYGRELYRRAKGYYQFINGAEKYRQQFFERKNLFNEILPYAIVFGLTDKFAKAINDIGIKTTQPTWYTGTQPFNPIFFSSSINNFSHTMSTAIASTPSKSGGFSGGGYSGGGFGGGGGGSW